MNKEDVEKLVSALPDQRTARKVNSATHNGFGIGGELGTGPRIIKLFKKILFKNMDTKSVERIQQIENSIRQIEDRIYKESGWRVSYDRAICYDNSRNTFDPEFATYDTFKLGRDDDGFYVFDDKPYNAELEYITRQEEEFLNKYGSQLEKLHKLRQELDSIITSSYSLADNPWMTPEIMKNIAEYLGYVHKPLKPRDTIIRRGML